MMRARRVRWKLWTSRPRVVDLAIAPILCRAADGPHDRGAPALLRTRAAQSRMGSPISLRPRSPAAVRRRRARGGSGWARHLETPHPEVRLRPIARSGAWVQRT